jgi:hypothetical protein
MCQRRCRVGSCPQEVPRTGSGDGRTTGAIALVVSSPFVEFSSCGRTWLQSRDDRQQARRSLARQVGDAECADVQASAWPSRTERRQPRRDSLGMTGTCFQPVTLTTAPYQRCFRHTNCSYSGRRLPPQGEPCTALLHCIAVRHESGVASQIRWSRGPGCGCME